MSPDLTVNSIVYKLNYADKGESLRQSTSRGVNLPDQLTIRSRAYTDAETKVPGVEYNVRLGRVHLNALGTGNSNPSYGITIRVPSDVEANNAATLKATFRALIADVAFIEAVMNGEK